MPRIPSVQSFLIADQVFQQAAGKWCLIGVFDRVMAARFPVAMNTLGLFVVLSDAQGDYDIKVEFRNGSDRLLAQFDGIKLQHVPHRLATVQFGFQTFGLPLPAPGRYFSKLYFNGQLVQPDIPLEATLLTVPT